MQPHQATTAMRGVRVVTLNAGNIPLEPQHLAAWKRRLSTLQSPWHKTLFPLERDLVVMALQEAPVSRDHNALVRALQDYYGPTHAHFCNRSRVMPWMGNFGVELHVFASRETILPRLLPANPTTTTTTERRRHQSLPPSPPSPPQQRTTGCPSSPFATQLCTTHTFSFGSELLSRLTGMSTKSSVALAFSLQCSPPHRRPMRVVFVSSHLPTRLKGDDSGLSARARAFERVHHKLIEPLLRDHSQHHVVLWSGDLNFRQPRGRGSDQLVALRKRDEHRKRGEALFNAYAEEPFLYAETCKLRETIHPTAQWCRLLGTQTQAPLSEQCVKAAYVVERRAPSYCDRILYRSAPREALHPVRVSAFYAPPMHQTDHNALYGDFSLLECLA